MEDQVTSEQKFKTFYPMTNDEFIALLKAVVPGALDDACEYYEDCFETNDLTDGAVACKVFADHLLIELMCRLGSHCHSFTITSKDMEDAKA